MSTMRLVRRVQLTGGSTYIVSIPKEWAASVGISKGSLVTLTLEHDGTIRVIPSAKKPQAATTAEVTVAKDTSQGAVVREVMSKYLVGYKTIHLKFLRDDPELRRVLKEVAVKKLIGAEVLHEDSHEMTIQVLVNIEDLPISSIILKMRDTNRSVLKDAMDAIRRRAAGSLNLEELLARDDIVDKLYLYGLRQLNTALKGYISLEEIGLSRSEEVLSYSMVLKNLERIGDHAVNIAINTRNIPGEFPGLEDLLLYGEEVTAFFEKSVKTFLNRDKKTANDLLDAKAVELREIEKRLTSIYSIGDAQLLTTLRIIAGSYRRVADYSSDILEATIDLYDL
ncbi:phosphate uptake regulator PhoU [Infirmifilum lucidum]|uniref:Phosphate uptake regulator PhoU n=1 Tax=Infirmifilum lucidum TaxID=2776706 RepID=A0A7L9FI58_9CREN|nr:phosphate uptake regulator PhoU [Infirmifilum lucidum]QOJ79331.1 phosphate uptake regulator PhoU [Infirmifilum lucidum]